ncbi:MAG: carboxypeptidase regulatory-like domain-containing protein, partial [Myxococcales bacterium]|nr:carboxypeptidase regulatory-like domain-containing protein [Myxococcales bacterium]
VAGVRVVRAERWGPDFGHAEQATRSDSQGRFTLTGLGPGKGVVAAHGGELGGSVDLELTLGQERTGIEIRVEPILKPLDARVVDGEGQGVAGCLVGLGQPVKPMELRGPVSFFWTDEEGALVGPLRNGSRVSVRSLNCPGKLAKREQPTVEPGVPVTLSVEDGHRLRGRLLEAEGAPAVGYALSISMPEDSPWSEFLALDQPLRSDAQGRFEIAGLPAGPLSVQVWKRGRIGPRFEVSLGEEPVSEIALSLPAYGVEDPSPGPVATRAVRVVDPEGRPV